MFCTFEIEHIQRSDNQYADALAALGSQIAFEGSRTRVEINKRRKSIIEILQERFQEKQGCEEDWRAPIREALLKEEDMARLKTLKDNVLMKGELYRRMPEGILSRCIGHEKVQRNLKEVHNRTCGFCGEISLQRVGFYWPSMGKDADLTQTQCEACHLPQIGKKAMLCLPWRIGEARSQNI